MKHLTEEEWIDYYYGESENREAMQEHIAQCTECSAAGGELALDLSMMRENESRAEGEPQRDASYGEAVWQTLRPSLTPYALTQSPRRNGGWRWNLRLSFASAAVALAVIATAAFYSGRLWEQRRAPQVTTMSNGQARQRIVLFVVSDHLDRSQRLLAELDDADEAAADHRLQATARELLIANRLYRQSSAHASADDVAAKNSSLGTILNDLEPVLIELANQPQDLSRDEIVRLRKELNTGGLLFEIRVLRSKVREDALNSNAAPQNGTI